MHVIVHRDFDIDSENYRTFNIVLGGNENFPLEIELIQQLNDSLQHRGLQLNNIDPDLMVYIQFNTERGNVFTPPLTRDQLSKTKDKQPDINTFNKWTTTEEDLAPRSGYGTQKTDMSQSLLPGYNTKVFINLIDGKLFREWQRTEPIWRGEVKCTGLDLDILNLSPYIFREVLSEFPNSTGKNPYREITLWDIPIKVKSKPRASGVVASVILILYIYILTGVSSH